MLAEWSWTKASTEKAWSLVASVREPTPEAGKQGSKVLQIRFSKEIEAV